MAGTSKKSAASYEAIRAAVASGDSLVGYERRNGLRSLAKMWYAAELELDPTLAVAPTKAALAAARVAGRPYGGVAGTGLRFARLAAYSGTSETVARRLADAGGVATRLDYSGRGRRYEWVAGKVAKATASKRLARLAAKANERVAK